MFEKFLQNLLLKRNTRIYDLKKVLNKMLEFLKKNYLKSSTHGNGLKL